MFLSSQIWTNVLMFVPLILVFVIFYFLMVKPEKRRQQQVIEMQNAVKKGDKVVTIGGIFGIIDDIKDDVVTLTIASGARMKLERRAIKRVVTEDISE